MAAGPESEVRYVVAGMPTGWAAMSKTVRELDEDKVKDYKEDIDTLLVFTGLFSAVLTAFVIVSYPMLSPDPQDTTNQYLAQISAQTNSYTVTAGAINSTTPSYPHTSPVFTPSLAALRINYCWFASLIASLVTASFAMLVKQWLREYLAYEYTSPQERLRARQFRHPGIATWKVYEIAGALPLLLQVALALFFLGLCFFTRSENHGIGDMCSGLVALWASFLVTATMAPAFSPQCPYKTPFLKPVMKRLRRHHVIHVPDYLITVVISLVFYSLSVSLILYHYLKDPRSLVCVIDAFPTSVKDIKAAFVHFYQSVSLRQRQEETEAIKEITNELSILTEVDTFLLDDDLLGTTMLDSLTQSYVEPSALIKFVLQAISLRLKGDELIQPLSSPPDLRRLPKRAWIAVSDIVAATVKTGLPLKATTVESWVQDATYLLFSISDQQLTQNARTAIPRVLQGAPLPQVIKIFNGLDLSPATIARFQELVPAIATRSQPLLLHKDTRPADVVAFIIRFLSLETSSVMADPLLTSTLDLRSVSEPVWQFCSNLLAATIEFALAPDRNGQDIEPWLESAIYILLSVSEQPFTPSARDAILRVLRGVTLPQVTKAFSELASSTTSAARFLGLLEPMSTRFDELLAQKDAQPVDLVAFTIHFLSIEARFSFPALPLTSTLDLRSESEPVWQFCSNLLAATIEDALGPHRKGQEIGPWLEDTIYILLSPSSHKLTPSSNNALAHLCSDSALRGRLGSCIQSSVSSFSDAVASDKHSDMFRQIQPEKIVAFFITLLTGVHRDDPLKSSLDLQSVSEPVWQFSADILGTVIEAFLGHDSPGLWFDDALHVLLSSSSYKLPRASSETLVQLCSKVSLRDRVASCIISSDSLFNDVFVSDHPLHAFQEVPPQDIVAFMISLLAKAHCDVSSLPLTSNLDLRSASKPVWGFSLNLLAATIEEALGADRKGQQVGSWLEDAIHILLSPSSYPLPSAGTKALVHIVADEAHYRRLSPCIRSLASPNHKDFVNTLSRLHGVLKEITAENDANWFLSAILYSIPCAEQCAHSNNLAPLLADHAPGHDEWTKHFTSILVERCRAILSVNGTWPPGSTNSLRALISLPLSSHALNPAIPEVVFALICSLTSSAGVLRALVSVEPDRRSCIVQDAAVRCVVSLVVNANTEGRQNFIAAMWKPCDNYLSEELKAKYSQIGDINLVRHVDLARKAHAEVRSDGGLFKDWSKYYTTCAKAMSIFRTTKYPALPDEEKDDTIRLAEECLGALEDIEPTTDEFDKWEASFDVNTSVFPDAIFQELAAFVADGDDVARKSKRVRRLRKISVIPGGEVPSAEANEPARSSPAAVVDSPEGAESARMADGAKSAEDESSLQSASSGLVVSSVREAEGVSTVPREVEGDIGKDPNPDLSTAAAREGDGQKRPGAVSTADDAASPSNEVRTAASSEHTTVHETKARGGTASDVPREQSTGVASDDEGKVPGGEVPLPTAGPEDSTSTVHDDERRAENPALAGESLDELVSSNASSSLAVSSSPEGDTSASPPVSQ